MVRKNNRPLGSVLFTSWSEAPTLDLSLALASDAGSHTPLGDLQACLQGAGRANLHAKREYPATGGRTFSAFFGSEVFRNFVDAFPRGALLAHHFGAFDRFEPAKCIF